MRQALNQLAGKTKRAKDKNASLRLWPATIFSLSATRQYFGGLVGW
jgi:hypothetical protein